MTATATNTATNAARAIIDAASLARLDRARLDADLEAARRYVGAAESASRHAAADVERATADLRRLAVALAHADETAPTVTESRDWSGDVTNYETCMIRARVYTEATGQSRRDDGPRRAVAVRIGQRAGRLYEPERGTSDPDKLAGMVADAKATALHYVAPYTGARWLQGLGIDPAEGPGLFADLVSVELVLDRSWYDGRGYLSPKWTVHLDGTRIDGRDRGGFDLWDLIPDNADRDPLSAGQPPAPEERSPDAWAKYERAMRDYWYPHRELSVTAAKLATRYAEAPEDAG